MKTYFNYEQGMSSKGIVEAISTPKGIGPFCGFGGHSISQLGDQITITAEPGDGNSVSADGAFYDRFSKVIHDRIKARNIFKGDGEDAAVNFGCISRDGYIYTSPETSMTLPIEGSKGITDDVIVIAVHTQVKEAVENPVEFRAFWSQSPDNFYDLYMRSIDPGYPTDPKIRDYDVDIIDPLRNTELNFQSLENKVSGALGGIYDTNSMCIIGIYGNGNNILNSNAVENYRIIPYESIFPMPIPHTTASHGLMKNLFSRLLALTAGVPEEYDSIMEYIKSLVTNNSAGSSQVINNTTAAMPKGSIIMWYGSQQTIPYGWELCDGGTSVNDPTITKPNLMGKVPVGLSTSSGDYDTPMKSGGADNITLKMDQMPKHDHLYTGDSNANGKYPQVESGFPRKEGTYGGETSGEGDGAGCVYHTTYTGGLTTEGSANPIDIRQPYTVLAFIIKTID